MPGTYLSEAIKGDYGHDSEDRLSQVFSASFNNSRDFRRHVARFLGCRNLDHATSSTQVSGEYGKARVRLDLVIYSRQNSPIAVIESKIDSELKRHQPFKYDKVKIIEDCKKFCVVKYYPPPLPKTTKWQVLYWGDFCRQLNDDLRMDDDPISRGFIAILKDYGMENPSTIRKNDLLELASALNQVRFRHEPSLNGSKPVFETLVTFGSFIEDLFRMAAKDPTLSKRAGKNFRPKMAISSWYWGERTKGKPAHLWIGCEVYLSKPHNGISAFAAALLFYDQKKPRQFMLVAYVQRPDLEWLDDMIEVKGTINCAKFKKDAIDYWERKLR